ncbi:MAG: hypothetical protein AB1428_08820 [Bacteroidota bacterium]
MCKQPLSHIVLGWLFILAGAVGFAYHATEINVQAPLDPQLILALTVRLIAIAGGIFLLRGAGRTRWLPIAWMAYHAIVSAFHSLDEPGFHVGILAIVSYFLLRRPHAPAP